MRRVNHWLRMFGLIALTAFAQSALARTCTAKTGNVNWSSSNSWTACGGNTPQSGDAVIIPNGSTVTLTQNNNAIASLTISNGGIINDNGNNLTVSGSITVNGTFGVVGGGGSLIANGTNVAISGTGTFADSVLQINNSATIASGSTLNFSAGGMIDVGPNAPPPNTVTLNIAGAITGSGQQNGNTILNGNGNANITVAGGGSINAPVSDITLVAGDVLTNNGTVISQTLTTDSGVPWTQGANSSLTLGSAAGFQGTLYASANGNTVTYPNGTAPIIPSGSTYFNLYGPTCAQVQSAALIILGTGPCGATLPYLQYHMDEASWAGTPGEVTDSSGNGLNGMAVNGATTANTTPAIAGNPGTCSYGVFDGISNYVALPNAFPNLTANFTITAWMRTTDNTKSGQRILIDDQNNTGGYGFSLGDGGTGMLRFYARGSSQIILDTANVISNNTWYFVAAVADISNAKRYIYVYNATGGFVTSANINSTGWGTDNGAASIGGENNSSAETGPYFHFSGNLDEVQVFNGALTQAALNTLAVQTHPCTGGSGGGTPSSFNAIDEAYTRSDANALQGHLYTKLAGTPFTVKVAALNSTGTGILSAYASSGSKTVTVKLIDDSVGTSCNVSASACLACSKSVVATQPMIFTSSDAGFKQSANFTVPAYSNLIVQMSDGTTTGCSTDAFSVRPSGFASVAVTSTLGMYKAGSDNIALAATTTPISGNSGYTGGVPKINAASVQVASPATVGTLSGSFAAATAGTSSATASGNFTYSEVGNFYFQGPDFTLIPTRIPGVYDDTWTAIDSGATADCISGTSATAYSNIKDINGKYGCNFGITADTGSLGRFIPDHFITVVNFSAGVPMACPDSTCPLLYNGMVYSGQRFSLTVTAQNAGNQTTLNYSTATTFAKTANLTVVGAPGTTTAPTGAGTLGVSSETAFVLGTLTETNESYSFTTIPTLPTNIFIRANDGEASSLRTVNPTTTSIEGGVKVASGHIKVSNAYGSELLPLTLSATAQYYTATGWLNSTTDSVTPLTLATSYPVGGGATAVTLNPATGILSGGVLTITLGKPSAGAGIATVTPTAPSYLPVISGTATFGVYKNNNNYIYRRESY
ncbi:DUF6701 domain-containing protein [Sideroxydans sp. CL21]|uniref:DUF6701 domain-containing protein n=1 Tax=Sideroxydans sp. CL21 TaxID=2600596 RepID=UPI0012A84B50|nr:DUF6701 domain-containing protein [Sideroxydans sp. CL21]VVC85298.1 MSHA biogenesis protein MshQ [Sideroxydans sp. CL21]